MNERSLVEKSRRVRPRAESARTPFESARARAVGFELIRGRRAAVYLGMNKRAFNERVRPGHRGACEQARRRHSTDLNPITWNRLSVPNRISHVRRTS